MSKSEWLRLPGVRYRCVPHYIPADNFDPLSRLFLEVLNYGEHSLPRLVRAFGLTERVVEDVLGELIRRNRATLVLHGGRKEIRPLSESIENVEYETGEPLEVWQDLRTMIVLPARMVERYKSFPGGIELVLSRERASPLMDDFINAPESQLIEMLTRADDNLRLREGTSSELDRLADRYRVNPQTIWLPVEEAELQGRVIRQLATEYIPDWATRIWAAALRLDAPQVTPGDVIEFHAAVTTHEEGERIVNGWRATTLLQAWREAVERFLRLTPAPVSGYDLREVRDHEALLRGVFRSVGQVELLDESPADDGVSWVEPVFDASRSWVALVLPWPWQAKSLLTWLRQRIEAGGKLPSSLIVVQSPPGAGPSLQDNLVDLLGPLHHVSVIIRRWPTSGPALVLGDGAEARALYAPRARPLRFSGASLAEAWRGILQALPSLLDEKHDAQRDDPLLSLRLSRYRAPGDEGAKIGIGGDACTVTAVIDELHGYGGTLLAAIIDPEQLLPDSVESDTDTITPGPRFDRQRSLIDQLPALSEECDAITYKLSLAPAPPWALWTHLAGYELIPTLVAVLTEPSRRTVEGELHILASGVSNETLWPSIVGLIKKAVLDHGWTIRIGLPMEKGGGRGDAAKNILLSLREQIPSPRLQFWALRRPAPAHALVVGDLAFIAGGDWLHSVLQQQSEANDFGFAMESLELAESLRGCFLGAEEILPFQRGEPHR